MGNILAFIPARGGSKRLPGKNIKLLGGVPLIAYSIKAALNSKFIDKVAVSTDDPAISALCLSFGDVAAVRRPEDISGDTATTLSAVLHCLEYLEANSSYIPEAVVLLQPTCPFREKGYIDRAVEMFLASGADSLIGVCEEHYKLGNIKGGFFIPDYKEGARKQDLPPIYRENGSIYITKSPVLKSGSLFGHRIIPFPGDKFNAVNIDFQFDFDIAEIVLSKYKDKFQGGAL